LTTSQRVPEETEAVPEDAIQSTEEEDSDRDDSEVTIKTLIKSMVGGELSDGVASWLCGSLMSITTAESMATPPVQAVLVSVAEPPAQCEASSEERGRGKRKKIKNRMYNNFWQHNDSSESDVDGK
jgi:hypothetical protein